MRSGLFGVTILAVLGVGLAGCAVTEVEEAWQKTHQARSPDIAQWSRGIEADVKGWLPGIRALPAGYAAKLN